MFIIDFFDFHSHLYGVDNIPLQSATIMSRFLNMLENGTYRKVNWYADKSLTFVRISDLFGFSSPAYFSRYVQQHLGVSPTEYRG